jgi:dTDP-4-amino-4,6-dideoxygalactose transaminase
MEKIWLSSPHMGGGEMKYVQQAFETNWIAPLGANVDGFEKDLEHFLGNEVHVAALSSGTAALHLALIMLGVKAGDEVICQSLTFSASANPIAYQGAIPVFVDSEEKTWNMDPEVLEEAILDRIKKKGKPKAIVIVHLYGMPAQMDQIQSIARKYEIPLVEDAAEALGSSYKGRALGTFGDMGILSFNGNKIITTSGGGALVSANQEWIKKARFLATQARDPAPHYQHSEIGYNYRMSNICAGIGRGQMEVLTDRVNQRRKNFTHYKNILSGIEGLAFVDEPSHDFYSNRWLTTILISSRLVSSEKIYISLSQDNIECRPIWKPMHLQPVFAQAPFYGGEISKNIFERGLCLPSGSNLKEDELFRIAKKIKSLF